MSIEQTLADLTAAVNNLTAVISSKIGAGAAAQATDTKPAKVETAKKDQKTAAALSAPPAATVSSTTAALTDAASGAIDFTAQVQKPIVAMAAGGKREQALAILKELGAQRASDIKPEDYAKAVELIAKAG